MGKKTEQKNLEDEVICDVGNLKGDTFEGTIEDVKVEAREITINKGTDDEEEVVRKYIVLDMDVPWMQEDTWEETIPVSDRDNSLWALFLRALKDDCGMTIEKPSDLKGQTFEFERRDVKLGNYTRERFPVPVNHVS